MPSGGMDHVADTEGVELNRLNKLYDFPEFVKKADWETNYRPRDIAVTTYADPVRRQFPCHTAASTWLSALYFTEKAAEFHEKDRNRIQHRLDDYVRHWRIKAAVDALRQKHGEYTKAAEAKLPDSAYAYVWVDDTTGHKERHLLMRNPIEVKAAADYLATYRDHFLFRDRNVMAQRILKKASDFGASLGTHREFLEKQAGQAVGDPDAIIGMIQDRARLAKLPALREQLTKLAMSIKDQPQQALSPDMLVELTKTVEAADRGMGLLGKYGPGLPRPEDVIFSATFTKVAEEVADMCPLTTGTTYKKSDFRKLAIDDLQALFGADFADEVRSGLNSVDSEKLAELVSTLPRNDAEIFDKMAREVGIHPVTIKAASAKKGFNDDELTKLAAAYVR